MNSDNLNSFFDNLNLEQQQEKKIVAKDYESLADRNPDLMRERDREYKDVEKHFVRTNYWLKTAQKIARQDGKQNGLKYLTLPAYYRLDVSLLYREGLLEITEKDEEGNAKEINVAAFEVESDKYGRMTRQVPSFKLFCLDKVENALVDSDNPYYEGLLSLFPFDIINLDLTTSLTPVREGPYTKTLKAIDELFRRQSSSRFEWAFFLTVRNMPENWENATLNQLIDNLQQNIDNHPEVAEALLDRYQVHSVNDLKEKDDKTCISQASVKWLIDIGHRHELNMHSLRCCYYSRYSIGVPPYDIYKYVVTFQRHRPLDTKVPTSIVPPVLPYKVSNLVQCVSEHKPMDIEDKLMNISEHKPIFEDLEKDVDELCKMVE